MKKDKLDSMYVKFEGIKYLGKPNKYCDIKYTALDYKNKYKNLLSNYIDYSVLIK